MKLTELIAPSFYAVHNDIKKGLHTEYWLDGGRASTKSSFAGVEIIKGIMNDYAKGIFSNAVAVRQVKDTTSESVYEQLLWAIEKLEVSQYWYCTKNPERIVFIPSGQRVMFRGMDKVTKLKSTKVSKGYIKYIWYEELTEMRGMEDIRSANQSLMRGGNDFVVFYTYNPPQSKNNWVNTEKLVPKENRLCHHSTYLDVPREWLGEPFIYEAEHLKKVNPDKYNHEYLGEVIGTGGEVFTNLTIREMSDSEIAEFWNISRAIDWGYARDPFSYTVNHYDSKKKRLYIFYEIYKVGLSNKKAFGLIRKENKDNKEMWADSAEPKSIAQGQEEGLRIYGVKKGPDSVEYGIKWLQDLEEIIIDPIRCPNTAKEFMEYELEPDGNGGFKAHFPDKNNHSIDGVRYSRMNDMTMRTITAGKRI